MNPLFQTIHGVKTAHYAVGQGHAAAVLLHGWGGSAQSFIDPGLAQMLADGLHGQVLVLDVPGFGASESPAADGWSSHQYAAWLQAFVQHNNLQHVPLVGHSNGGRIILRYVLDTPDAHPPIVLIASSGVQWPLSPKQRTIKLIAKLIKPFKQMIPQRLQRLIMTKVFKAHDWSNAAGANRETLRKLVAEPCMRDQLQTIKSRTLLLWGAHDTMTPPRSRDVLSECIPDVRSITFDTGRHGIHRTHTQGCAQAITAFLSTS